MIMPLALNNNKDSVHSGQMKIEVPKVVSYWNGGMVGGGGGGGENQ